MIYLDNAATTPMLNEVLDEMMPYMKDNYGNPSSIHKLGRQANNALQLARKRISTLINTTGEIVFASGATEANNLALKGLTNSMKNKGNHVITSSIEHDAILEPCKELERNGLDVTYLPVDKYGMIELDELESAIKEETILISIMFANNEVGTIQPIKEIAEIAHKHDIVFHTDAVQVVGKIAVDVQALGIDMITLSAHKMYGPKGVGVLCINNDLKIEPILHGGGQEDQIRSGTQNVAGIVGMGKAAELSIQHMDEYTNHVTKLRDHLIDSTSSEIRFSKLNGHPTQRLPSNAHFTFLGVNGEDLIIKLDENGIEASTGSACSIKKQKASHVLMAMGFNYEEITGSLRLTLGIQNTIDEIELTVSKLGIIVNELREISPYKYKYT
ncbi:MAG: cysteine desulfurase NifS [Thaumarchaeota archaeon]|nr:cysteine desulfurase NifS [Nitrososphaerota archaeon]|tara:strand:- start:434 stop:1591 length:1158 start_codon:yes stop_codon:yes gene_type:complete